MISAREIGVSIQNNVILDKISFDLIPGELCAITGASGSGKTTFLNCMGLLQNISSGKIYLHDQDFTHASERKKRDFWRNDASFIFQDYGLIDDRTVQYNVKLSEPSFFTRSKPDSHLLNCLQRVGLVERVNEICSKLSGGEKQRVGFSRALYKRAKYIFADEPTASLDADNRQIVTGLLKMAAEQGAAVLIATHDERLAAQCDRNVSLPGH